MPDDTIRAPRFASTPDPVELGARAIPAFPSILDPCDPEALKAWEPHGDCLLRHGRGRIEPAPPREIVPLVLADVAVLAEPLPPAGAPRPRAPRSRAPRPVQGSLF